ncbi:MAG: PEGA domain-containing protein [Kiritimatiellaeota bacterium]|nr:PEGA domain-containing protein [Kiritimatiellota bacterium]
MKKWLTQTTVAKAAACAGATLILAGAARAQDAVRVETTIGPRSTSSSTEEITLSDGSKVVVNIDSTTQTRVMYTGKNSQDKKLRRVAVFTKNNAGAKYDDALENLKDQLVSKVSGDNFEIIDFQDAVMAMHRLPEALKTAEGVEQTRRVLGLQTDLNRLQGNPGQRNLGGQGMTADETLLAQTSNTRLAQMLGADYIMRLNLDDLDKTPDEKLKITAYKGSVSYTLMDFNGYSIGGGDVEDKLNENKISDRVYLPDLIKSLADKLAKEMNRNAQKWRESSLAQSQLPVSFDAQAMTMDGQPMYIQFDMTLNQVVANDAQIPVRVAALVEVDGVAQGTTDCEVPLAPGAHKVRFHRDGLDDVTMTINAREGLKIVAPMRITEGEMARVQALQRNIHNMTLAKETNQAIAEKIRGEADMLRESHIRVDATNLPDVNILQTVVPLAAPVLNVNTVNQTTIVE